LNDQTQYDRIFTQDETWIDLDNARKRMWNMNGVERPKQQKKFGTRKVIMISVILNGRSIVSVSMLARKEKFKDFYIDTVMDEFSKRVTIPHTKDRRKFKFH